MHICFFNDTATTEIYTLSLHDALPISKNNKECHRAADQYVFKHRPSPVRPPGAIVPRAPGAGNRRRQDRKSTRLNSSHANISYAVFCLKKKSIDKSSALPRELRSVVHV